MKKFGTIPQADKLAASSITSAQASICFDKIHTFSGYKKTSLVAQKVKHLPIMQETQVRSLCWEDPLEKEMAIHSCTFAWKIPWMEEPSRLQSMRSQRVGHD